MIFLSIHAKLDYQECQFKHVIPFWISRMTQKPRVDQTVRQMPVKWALALVALLIVYAIAQPIANRTFGWSLPSLASILGEGDGGQVAKNSEPNPRDISAPSESTPGAQKRSPSNENSSDNKPTESNTKSNNKSSSATNSTTQTSELASFLKETGRDRFVSPAGLVYGPGSEEGHRLKHLQRHLEDQPNRTGKHGVFDGEMANVLRWIDDAYQRANNKAKGTSVRQDDGRTIIEASFDQPIGYIGGRDGRRDNNPPARRLRLVVEGKNVITAFPF
jgi:hypothetical protein